jgi:hypothetical protein
LHLVIDWNGRVVVDPLLDVINVYIASEYAARGSVVSLDRRSGEAMVTPTSLPDLAIESIFPTGIRVILLPNYLQALSGI